MHTKKVYILFLLISLFFVQCKQQTSTQSMIPENIKNNKELAIATLAGGCFWCIETTMARLKGVDTVLSGYIGGHIENPSYEAVCTGTTGHAEAVQIYYNPTVIDYQTLLTVFFSLHNPCTLNRQGGDIGAQYRSAIFYHDDTQKSIAENYIKQLETDNVFSEPIVTSLEPLSTFYIAEDYHQNYYNLNRERNSYCTAVIDPKVTKLRQSFSHLLKD